jgi:hypothetical protein
MIRYVGTRIAVILLNNNNETLAATHQLMLQHKIDTAHLKVR